MSKRVSPNISNRLKAEKHRHWRKNHVKKQNGLCFYCRNEMRPEFKNSLAPTLDHYVPIAKGGKDHFENTVAACKRCNELKGNMHGDDFVRLKTAATA